MLNLKNEDSEVQGHRGSKLLDSGLDECSPKAHVLKALSQRWDLAGGN